MATKHKKASPAPAADDLADTSFTNPFDPAGADALDVLPVDADDTPFYDMPPRPRRSAAVEPGDPADAMPALAAFDAAAFFGPNGPLAAGLYGYEQRPSQVEMASAVQEAILTHQHALIEAPTGTGKSIAYLAPAILSGKTVVISTANKSLQSQLYQKDLPFLRKVLGRAISAVVVKGRSNFICNLKWDKELAEQRYISLYDREDEQVATMRKWLDETATGDIDELPFVVNPDLRPRIVSFPDDCLHGDCRFDEDGCWVNQMRDAAAEAQVLITNHHLLLNALQLGFGGERILPPASIYIVDEAHHLEQIATAVFETVVTDYTVEQLLARTTIKENTPEEEIEQLRFLNTLAFQEVANQSRDNSFQVQGELESMKKLSTLLSKLGQRMKESNPYREAVEKAAQRQERPEPETAEKNRYYELAVETINSAANKLAVVATSRRDDKMVRYAQRLFDRRYISIEVHAAPINPAELLAGFLFQPLDDQDNPVDRTVICTSATLATDNHFAHFKARCGIAAAGVERVLPTVFDYPQQAVLYQPPLPAYDYKSANAYYDGVAAEIERLLEVSRGRTLCLFTSWSGLQQVNDRLQAAEAALIWPVRAQGDAPREALLTWFKDTAYSVLLATRSFWEGVDIPGEDLSLVVLDKLPFPTPGDPLHGARMRAIEANGQSSFDDYMVPLMTLSLKQGFGRLIRRASDRGVVAILDERLTSKGYGRRARRDLPPARFSREFKDVHKFYQTALATHAEFALNVWAWPAGKLAGSGVQWRWQLLRLQDGKADLQTGQLDEVLDPARGELHAAVQGLTDLHQRIQRAGRPTSAYAVEVRCTQAAAGLLNPSADPTLAQAWQAAIAPWRHVELRMITV